MNDNTRYAQVTIEQLKRLMTVLDDLGQRLPNNPKLYAFMSEAPIDDMQRMLRELDEYLEPLKRVPHSAVPATNADDSISTPAAPGPIESTS
jgi:hypothetical protein